MDKIYIFDVDGTLTPSRRQMDFDFEEFFYRWSKDKKYYLVSGSNIEKIKEQIGHLYLKRAQGIFACSGNKYYVDDKLIYENKFEVSRKLKKLLGTILSNSRYPYRYGNHIEDRGSMVNFSIVGRDCNQEQREEYFRYDNENNERKIIAEAVHDKFPNLDVAIGGQISIDIVPKGNDKSQVLEHIQNNFNNPSNPNVEYIFIGDRTMEGGNDYPLAKVMKEMDDCEVYQAGKPSQEDGYLETKKILEALDA